MSPFTVAVTSAGFILGGALAGMALSRMLPDEHLSSDSRDAIKLGSGMISLMAALVLGLLVSSAKSNYDAASAAVTQGGARIILLDRVLAHYGPESEPVRDELRRSLGAALELLWPVERRTEPALQILERDAPMEKVLDEIRALTPRTDAQRALHAQAQQLGNEILLSRWIQVEQARATLPRMFLQILVFWLTMLYLSFGLIAPRNATVLGVLFVGALSLATAFFLVLEMDDPMEGMIQVSSAPMRKAFEQLGPADRSR
jgi:hypothetical protein